MNALKWQVKDVGLLFSMADGSEHLPPESWITSCEELGRTGVSHVLGLIETGEARPYEGGIVVEHQAVADFPSKVAESLELPAITPFYLHIKNEGTLDQAEFQVSYFWCKPNRKSVVGPLRRGSILEVGGKSYRVPLPLYRLVEGIEKFNAVTPDEADERFRLWAELTDQLPEGGREKIQKSAYLESVKVAYADAFSLSIFGEHNDLGFDPSLFNTTAGKVMDGPVPDPEEFPTGGELSNNKQLLSSEHQKIFAENRFKSGATVRSKYALGDGFYVALSSGVVKGLSVVRQMQSQAPDIRREFIKNPRSYLREALADELDGTLIEQIFLETTEYSDRVREIGLWQPKVIPWVSVSAMEWLPPAKYGLMVDGKKVDLSSEEMIELRDAVEAGIAEGIPSVSFHSEGIPATKSTLDALDNLELHLKQKKAREPDENVSPSSSDEKRGAETQVLLIEDNLDEASYEEVLHPRSPALDRGVPNSLSSTLKRHQMDGLEWLQTAWLSGRKGVLLADDMGLGKTLQAMCFGVWLQENLKEEGRKLGPFLVVAPTGLLKNWEAEHDLHFSGEGLGKLLLAYGEGLNKLRKEKGKELEVAKPMLDTESFNDCDWVLTTYETLRDYQHSFGLVPFRVIVFDEAQKIKTPGTILTEAAKAMKPEFVLAMTGTPIENRLADIWCILDTTHPGYLEDLKSFSQQYEGENNNQQLHKLKEMLTKGSSSVPSIFLRRMKDEELPGLPSKELDVRERAMPEQQRQAYRSVLEGAENISGRAKMLRILNELRRISLHPDVHDLVSDREYIGASARYSITFEILEEIAKKGEKVLIFIEFEDAQLQFISLFQRRFNLTNPPGLISGRVSGYRRMEQVTRFQNEPPGFGAMVLSPRAGGVGLTLTAANHVIHLTRWWNPAVEDQCTDRVYRIGQNKEVTVYCPLAIYPPDPEHSFDLQLNDLLTRKRELSRDVLAPSSASNTDIAGLFNGTLAGR